jgi:NADPH:quinone reductase-like Zn-dependent oxidoreductase
VKGFWGSVVSKTMPAETKGQLFGELITRVLDGSLTLPVAETFPFEQVRDAVRASDTAGRVGKVLLRP